MVFTLINFIILMIFMYVVIRPAAEHFFYARNRDLKKKITTSAENLHSAGIRLKRAQEDMKALPAEIDARRIDAGSMCKKECKEIILDAKRNSEHLLKVVWEQIQNEEKLAADSVRKEMIMEAIADASKRLVRVGDGEFHKRLFSEGVEDMKSAIAS